MSMKHPLAKHNFDTIYDELSKRVELGLIDKKVNGDLELFNYSKECQFSKAWDEFTMSARGLILNPLEQKIVALPFGKFFNYGESSDSLPNESFEVYNKYDGSLGIGYYHNGQWYVATRGSFDSEQAVWATEFLRAKARTQHLMTNFTYLFEIIYPENRIVIDYKGWSGLVLLGAYNNTTLEELENVGYVYMANFDRIGGNKDIICAESLSYPSIDRMLEVCKTMTHNKEGFVVRFQNGFRIKIKGDAYCRIHKLVSNVTPLGVWNALKNNDNVQLILRDLPEEFHKDWNSMRDILLGQRSSLIGEARAWLSQWLESERDNKLPESQQRKAFALWVQSLETHYLVKQLLFAPESRWDYMIYKHIRPTGNSLPGYVPSNSMNRFEQSEE